MAWLTLSFLLACVGKVKTATRSTVKGGRVVEGAAAPGLGSRSSNSSSLLPEDPTHLVQEERIVRSPAKDVDVGRS